MGQFKPMVKMETTEPTIELKLKKGGKVAMPEMKKADGGMMMPPAMPARGGMPAAMSPKKPSMMARRRAMRGMPAKAAPAGPVGMAANMPMPAMKKGGDMSQDKSMIKKAFKQHDMQEHKGGKGTKLKLKDGGCATGGVTNGQGGYATGGVVKGQGGYKDGGSVIPVSASKKGAGAYAETKMDTAKKNVKTGDTGEVKLGNGGGYKKGGATKKFADGGSVDNRAPGNRALQAVFDSENSTAMREAKQQTNLKYGPKKYASGGAVQDDGKAVKMPQGNKKPSSPVSINELSGTFKKGGKVKKMAGGSC